MEDIAFSDWPGQHVDLSGSNPWLPAYGFQPPANILEREDFLGSPDADLFLHGSASQHYMYLETIQEETSDDLRSDSDRTESRGSPVGWLDTNSESGSVIRIDIDEIDCDSDREVACPAKRRRQDNLLSASDDESCHSLSRSSSLLQFESFEKQCQDISNSSPSIFSSVSFDSLENQRKTDISPDSLEEKSTDFPSRDSLLYNATRANDSDSSESADSEGTLGASCRSVDNLKTWRSFDELRSNTSPVQKSSKEVMSAENLSEDSGYGDHSFNYAKGKSSSNPNVDHGGSRQKAEKGLEISSGAVGCRKVRSSVKKEGSYVGFSAYDGDVFSNSAWNFSVSFHDLSVVDNLYVAEYKSPLIDRFVRGSSGRNRLNSEVLLRQANTLNIEKTSECTQSSKYNCASASEPNLPQAVGDAPKRPTVATVQHCDQSYNKACYFENSVCISSVPKDLNLAGELKADIWSLTNDSPSIAEKNWDLGDLNVRSPEDFRNEILQQAVGAAMPNRLKRNSSRQSPDSSTNSDEEMGSFRREGSYTEAMSHMIDISDDEYNPCYKEDIARSTILDFDRRILKAISETSIKSFGDSNSALDMLFGCSTPTSITSSNKRNVVSTPNLTLIKREDSVRQTPPSNPVQKLKRKCSSMNRSASTSGVSDPDEKPSTPIACNSKGVHFSPVVSEVNWQDDSNSPGRESSYSLSSTPDRAPSPPTPPLIRPTPRMPTPPRVSSSQPDLKLVEERQRCILTDKTESYGFAPLRPQSKSVSQPNLRRRSSALVRRDSDGALVQAYTDGDGVTYKHTHLDLRTADSSNSGSSPTTERHVGDSKRAEVKQGKAVHGMEPNAARETSKHTTSRVGKLGGFFSRIASFRFSNRKNDDKSKRKKLGDGQQNKSQVAAQRLATKEDYIYIPLKTSGGEKDKPALNNNNKVEGCVSAKPPLPKLPPRVVGASVKRRPETNAQLAERRGIDYGDALPRPMEPMGLIETDLDTEVTVITSGAHVKTRSLMNLGAEAPPSSLAAPPHPSRPHKSMEFLLDKQNLKVVEPPENELQKGERVMSEHQLRVQRSLQKLTVPDWYKQSKVPREGFLLKKHSNRESSRWTGTSSKTTSLNSLGSSNQSPTVLSPTPHSQPFVRWSTSKLNSTASSPCASTRSSFNARQPNGSISPSSIRSSFSYRQPYMGWRSQERLARPRTPAERLASSLLQAQVNQDQQESPEIQTSIKEVTSAIVHYVSGLRPEDGHRSSSASPRGSQKLCWLESSFVGSRPLDSPQTPVALSERDAPSQTPSVLRLELQNHKDVALLNTGTATKPSPGSTTLEDVLDSLLGLPSSTRAPSPSLQETESANTSPTRLADQFRRHSEGSDSSLCHSSIRINYSSPLVRCRYSRCGKVASATSTDGLAFKNCHNCSYTYCSRACRRAHWEKHRKTCLFSRVGTLCRHVLAAAKEQPDTLLHLSTIARRGCLAHGPGAVKCFFHCPEAAEKFLLSGLERLGEPTYIPWPDLLPSEMGPQMYTELVKMCKSYNPGTRLVLYVSICVVSEAPTTGAVKWERQLVSRCAKMRISKDIFIPEKDVDNPETLILTCPPIKGSNDRVLQLRESSFNNIQKHLRERGVSLRRHYPDIYKQLCVYTENDAEKFTPVTIHPRDTVTGKSFMCIIMPDVETDSVNQVVTAGVHISTVDVLND